MERPDVTEKWAGKINTVTIGATEQDGGSRQRTVTIGGQTTLPFMTFEGAVPHPPVIAGFVSDSVPDWPEFLKDAIGDEINSPGDWARKAVENDGADVICLKLTGADPAGKDATPDECARAVEEVLKAVKVPLIIWGCGDDEKDSLVLPACSSAARGENCLIGSAKESNYRTVAAICKADGHKIIAEAPVDINIAKQVNILLQDVGFDLKDVVMYQITGALGYGLDYVYSIMERARIAGLKGDSLTALPQICDVAGETWRVKEAVVGEDELPGWGNVAKRGIMWETVCASNYLLAGADIVTLAHPESVKRIKEMISTFS